MKATGIVRRIDELGRVVIPKEIRSTLRLKSGDPILTTLKDQINTQNADFNSNLADFTQNMDNNTQFTIREDVSYEDYYILAMLSLKERLKLNV